jgi:hypothetical protein
MVDLIIIKFVNFNLDNNYYSMVINKIIITFKNIIKLNKDSNYNFDKPLISCNFNYNALDDYIINY